jgi:EAL domain-containing protein (putative c-di-GMP-specific phosphodiesterase class I)
MEISDIAATGTLAGKIKDALGAVYQFEGNELHVTASIGICPYNKDVSGPDSMLSRADLALYRAKAEGRNQYRFHSDELDKEVHERVTLADDLRNAIERNELELYYQPQVELASGRIVGMEALVRWNHPTRGLMTPDSFLPIAEKTGVIAALGHWVLEGACRQMEIWRGQGVAPPVIAINVAQAQLRSGRELVTDITETLARCHLAPSDLELDVTESMLAQLAWTQNDVLTRLQQIGVRIALDNFGTEYSSFDYVRTYKVTRLKIAQCFIEMAASDVNRATTIRTIINLARDMGIEVVAEGVESEDQRALLVSLGPETKGQGFYFSKAVTASRAGELLGQLTITPQPASPTANAVVELGPTKARGAPSKPPLDAA